MNAFDLSDPKEQNISLNNPQFVELQVVPTRYQKSFAAEVTEASVFDFLIQLSFKFDDVGLLASAIRKTSSINPITHGT